MIASYYVGRYYTQKAKKGTGVKQL